MRKCVFLGNVALCLAACGAPAEGDWVEPTGEVSSAITIPDDPLFPDQWGLQNTGQLVPWTAFDGEVTFLVAGVRGVDINMPLAWDITQGASDVLVGIAETEDVDIGHEDLQNQILRNQGEIGGDGIDNDGNGCVDDDFGCDFRDGNGVYDPITRHATHVAGTVGARIKNAKGIAGVAPKVKLVPLTSEVQNETFIRAIEYAEANGIRVINCSQGNFTNEFFNPAVRDAMAAANVLFVCSGGNRGTPRLNFPSSYPGANILSVANVTNIGELSEHSTYGSDHVDIAAPGRSILSSVLDNGYEYIDGTSHAAPHVAGVAALLMKRFPNLTVVQIADRLKRTAMRMTTLNGMVGANGMVDARAALEDVSPIQVGATSQPGSITLSWNAQAGATRYDVERDGAVVSNGTATSHVHSGLAADSGHIYRVRAIIGSSTGAWSHRLMAKASLMPTSEPYVRESSHPYENDISLQPYVIRKPGATRLRVHFARVDTLRTGDFIQYNKSFTDDDDSVEDDSIGGSYPSGFWTHWVD
jgi:subtilisin family serine protease